MNYDRLLTRVFDKQEKKMIYSGDEFNSNHHGNSPCLASYKLIGIDSCGLVATDPWKHEIELIPFGDRFIPMMCSGYREGYREDGKLAYEYDFIKTCYGRSFLVEFEHGCLKLKALAGEYLDDDIGSLYNNFEIIGNKWENEKLLEVKE